MDLISEFSLLSSTGKRDRKKKKDGGSPARKKNSVQHEEGDGKKL